METPPGDCVGGADEVERAAHRADVAAAGHLAVDLPGEVHLDRGVDGDEALDAGEHGGAVRVVGGAQPHARVVARPVEQALRAHQRAAGAADDRASRSTTPSQIAPEW